MIESIQHILTAAYVAIQLLCSVGLAIGSVALVAWYLRTGGYFPLGDGE